MRFGICMLTALLLGATLVLPALHAAEPKKDDKSPLPGKAAWDLRAFNIPFKVIDTTYDAEKSEAHWELELKDGVRTADLVRELDRDKPFVFVFLDEDMSELARVRLTSTDFKGIPKERVIKQGAHLIAVLQVPESIGKTKKVILQRGKSD
jgi:hypothetical protein